jgi:predicted transcriptional regulator
MNTKTTSPQMLAALRLLDCEGSMTARQLNDRLYGQTSAPDRRVFAASMARSIRRLERRGLVVCEKGTIAITHSGWIAIHPEQVEAMLTSLRESVRQTVAQAWREFQQSQDAPVGG